MVMVVNSGLIGGTHTYAHLRVHWQMEGGRQRRRQHPQGEEQAQVHAGAASTPAPHLLLLPLLLMMVQ